jgi:hypothetical protein
LSADGSIVAIGAIGNDGGGSIAGHARVYEWITLTSSWTQKGADIDGEAAGDRSGWSVSLSADGNIVAIGAIRNNDNGSFAGHVRIYEWITLTSSWTQKGADIDGEAANDQSGYSVSLSTDGLIVAIGAVGNGSNSGHTRVYSIFPMNGQGGSGYAGDEKKIKRQLPGTFSFTVGLGGSPNGAGGNTTLVTETETIIVLGGQNDGNGTYGETGHYNGYGAGGGNINGYGGSDKAFDGDGVSNGSGAQGIVIVTYS